MLFSRKKMNVLFLVLAVAGSQVSAGGTDYVAQAKQKARTAYNWSAQVAQESYAKTREKAQNAYAIAREKANVLYEKAKENKLLTAGAAYVALEASLLALGKYTLFGRIFLLPGKLNEVNGQLRVAQNITVPNLQNQLNGANHTIHNLQNTNTNVQNARVNLQNQLNNAQNTINAHAATIANLENEMITEIGKHDADVERLERIRQKVRQLRTELHHLEYQNELDKTGFALAMKNVGEQIGQLNDVRTNVNDLQGSLNQAHNSVTMLTKIKDSQKRDIDALKKQLAETEDKYLQNASQNSRNHGAQAVLNQQIEQLNKQIQGIFDLKHDAIISVLNAVNEDLQSAIQNDELLDAALIINTVVGQAKELMSIADLNQAANLDKLDTISETLGNTLQQTITHLINQISNDAQGLEQDLKEMLPVGQVTADNFEQKIAPFYNDINTCFAKLNDVISQFNWIAQEGDNHPIIKYGLDNCHDTVGLKLDNAICSLGAVINDSLQKVRQSLHAEGDNVIADSYDDAFKVYVHGLVAHSAYESYNLICSQVQNSDACLDWAKQFEEDIIFITHYVFGNMVQVKAIDGSFDTMSNSTFLHTLGNSMIGLSQVDLTRSSIDNHTFSSFFNHSTQSSIVDLKQRVSNRSSLGNSSMSVAQEDSFETLLALAQAKSEQEWEEELNALSVSVTDLQESRTSKIHYFQAKSQAMNEVLSGYSPAVAQKLASMFSSSTVDDSLGLSNLDSSASQSQSQSGLKSSFVSANKWAKDQERLNNSIRFANRDRFSKLPYFGPMGYKKNYQASGLYNNSSIILSNESIRNSNVSTQSAMNKSTNDTLVTTTTSTTNNSRVSDTSKEDLKAKLKVFGSQVKNRVEAEKKNNAPQDKKGRASKVHNKK